VFGRSHQPWRQFQAGFIACFDLTPRCGIGSTELDDAISPEVVRGARYPEQMMGLLSN
jgi:hypothetical protein